MLLLYRVKKKEKKLEVDMKTKKLPELYKRIKIKKENEVDKVKREGRF